MRTPGSQTEARARCRSGDTLFPFQRRRAADASVWTLERGGGGSPTMSSTHTCSPTPAGRHVGGRPEEPRRLLMARAAWPTGSGAPSPTRGTGPCHMTREAPRGPSRAPSMPRTDGWKRGRRAGRHGPGLPGAGLGSARRGPLPQTRSVPSARICRAHRRCRPERSGDRARGRFSRLARLPRSDPVSA